MKVRIDENGVMWIEPQSSFEIFAIREWRKQALVQVEDLSRAESSYWRGSKIIVTEKL